MKPYYSRDGIEIYHGDCIAVLSEMESNTIKSIVTDPPFSSGSRQDAGKSVRGTMLRSQRWENDWFSHDNLATFGFLFLMRMVCVQLLRVTVQSGSAHLFIDWRMYPNLYGSLESSGWIVKNLVVWDKVHFGMGSNYRNQHEFIIYAEKPGDVSPFIRHDLGNVLSCPREQAEFHPTQKPEPLLEAFIEATTREDDVVLDPFCGSGSTLIAAQNLRRRAIGIEIDKNFCDIAVERLGKRTLFAMPNSLSISQYRDAEQAERVRQEKEAERLV